jgi:TRAP-type C4-dicarboxylate transport system permease small subunit
VKSAAKLLASLERLTLWIGGASLLLLALLQCASVAARLFRTVVPASAELAIGLTIVMVSAALVAATLHGSHATVRFLERHVSASWRRVLHAAVMLLSLLYWLLLCWQALVLTLDNSAVGERTEILGLNLIPFRFVWVAALFAILAALLLQQLNAPTRDRDSK